MQTAGRRPLAEDGAERDGNFEVASHYSHFSGNRSQQSTIAPLFDRCIGQRTLAQSLPTPEILNRAETNVNWLAYECKTETIAHGVNAAKKRRSGPSSQHRTSPTAGDRGIKPFLPDNQSLHGSGVANVIP